MDDPRVIAAVISGVVALITAAFTHAFILRREREEKRREQEEKRLEERKTVQLEYLNPLRLYLIENHFRLSEILARLSDSQQQQEKPLLVIEQAAEISGKEAALYNGTGCYLVSSCYLTACLFGCLYRVRQVIPFLELSNKNDTELLALSTSVSLGFLRNLGIFYVTQFSIGTEMYNADDNRLLSYREFCDLLSDEKRSQWFYRLIDFYLQTGRGENLYRVNEALQSIKNLAEFLDHSVGGGESLAERYRLEGIDAL